VSFCVDKYWKIVYNGKKYLGGRKVTNNPESVITILGISFTWEAIGIAIAAIFSIINFLKILGDTIINNRNTNKQFQVNYITDKRVDWIYKVREVASEFTALTINISMDLKRVDSGVNKEVFLKYGEAMSHLKLLLNFNGDIDAVIINLIDKIYKETCTGNFKESIKLVRVLTAHLQIYLKLEWNRVNSEVKTRKYSQKQFKEDTIQLYEKYINKADIEKYEISDIYELLKK